MSDDAILDAVAAYYEASLAEHGATAQGVNWRDGASQALRHHQFLRLIRDYRDASVLDFGCGYGDFLTFLRNNGHTGPYIGVDIAPGMIAKARDLHRNDAHQSFHIASDIPVRADFAIASGIFNVVRGSNAASWERYVASTIDMLAAGSRIGFGFNMLSLNSDPEKRRDDLHYGDPIATLDGLIARHGRHVAFLQDYGLWEFTVLVRHAAGNGVITGPDRVR